MRISASRNIFHVHLNFAFRESYDRQTEHLSKYIPKSRKPKHSPPLSIKTWRNFSTTWDICDHRHPNQLLLHMATSVCELASKRKGISTALQGRFNGPLEKRVFLQNRVPKTQRTLTSVAVVAIRHGSHITARRV